MGLGSAITYVDGHLWTGHTKLFLTTDNGATWIDRTPSAKSPKAYIMDIEFFDRDHGSFVTQGLCGLITGCEEDDLFITTDGGLSWSKRDLARSATVSYMGSPNAILTGGNRVETTLDGGVTWRSQAVVGELAASSVYFGDGKAGVFIWGRNRTSYLYLTTDLGNTWRQQRSFIDYDCYDMVFDSCSNTLFVVNEEWLVKDDDIASAIISTDMGDSWNTVCAFPYVSNTEHSINGAVDITPFAWYLQTGSHGILRSVDQGRSWTLIGGPSGVIDTRGIVVPQDNLIYAIGNDSGSVWMSTNGGGKPMTTPSSASLVTLSRDELFTDSVAQVCGRPIRDELKLGAIVCGSLLIKSIEIVGGDSASYEIADAPIGEIAGTETLSVLFAPSRNGHYASTIVITFLDSTTRVVQLRGTADLIVEHVAATLSDVAIDTLGEHAFMELRVEPGDLTDDVIVQIGHDPGLHYGGTFAYDGTPLQILPSNGTISFIIPGDKLQASLPDAVIRFENVTAIPRVRYEVTIDSLSVTPFSKGCYSTLALESSGISVPVECGTIALSRFLRNETIAISVSQHRDSKTLEIRASHKGHYAIALIDLLGNVVLTENAEIDSNTPALLQYSSLASGVYLVTVRGNESVSSHRVQILE